MQDRPKQGTKVPMNAEPIKVNMRTHVEGMEELKAKAEALQNAIASVITLAGEVTEAAARLQIVVDDGVVGEDGACETPTSAGKSIEQMIEENFREEGERVTIAWEDQNENASAEKKQ